MSSRLWDGRDGERPALALDLADIDLLCLALQHVGSVELGGLETEPSPREIAELLAECRRWYEAEAAWWTQTSTSDPLDERPF
jgi:hypothetical protein